VILRRKWPPKFRVCFAYGAPRAPYMPSVGDLLLLDTYHAIRFARSGAGRISRRRS
jgi:hypothetical protein